MIASSAPNGSSISSTSASWAERPGERDALAHAAGQLVRPLVGEVPEPDEVEQVEGALAALAASATPRSLQRELDVRSGGAPGEQAASWNMSALRPSHVDRAGRRRVEAGDEESSVDLPHPDAPTMQTNSPRSTVNVMPSSATTARSPAP